MCALTTHERGQVQQQCSLTVSRFLNRVDTSFLVDSREKRHCETPLFPFHSPPHLLRGCVFFAAGKQTCDFPVENSRKLLQLLSVSIVTFIPRPSPPPPSVSPSTSLYLSVCLFGFLFLLVLSLSSVCLGACLSACLPACLPACLSVHRPPLVDSVERVRKGGQGVLAKGG